MTATTILRSEHDHILALIACLRAACTAMAEGENFDTDFFTEAVDVIRNYADAWHHAKEENLLFPALEAAGMPREGGPIAVMLQEHGLGRTYVRKMTENLEASADGDDSARSTVLRFALAYANLLTQHIQKENNILFNMADQVLSPDQQERLEREYETAAPPGALPETGARYEERIAALCRRWKVDPVAAASAGATFHCG